MNRQQRVRLIRHRVVTGAVALFVAAWLVIAITLISGNDPALSRNRATTVASNTGSATTTTPATTTNATPTRSTASSTPSTPNNNSSVTTRAS